MTDPTERTAYDPQWLAIAHRLITATSPEEYAQLRDELHGRYEELLRGAKTSGGLPYPDPTDPIGEGADAIRSLAEALDPAPLVLPKANLGPSVTADTSIPPSLTRTGSLVRLEGVISVGVGYQEANLLTIPAAYEIASTASAMLDAVVTSAGKVLQLYLRGTDQHVLVIWRDGSPPGANESFAVKGTWLAKAST